MQVSVVMHQVKLNNKTFMLMDAPPEKEDCVPFVTIDEFFIRTVFVYHILWRKIGTKASYCLKILVMCYCLHSSMTRLSMHIMSKVLSQLIQLQSIDGEGHFPAYSYEKLMTEMSLLTDWLLPSLQIRPSDDESALIKRTFAILANAALAQPSSDCTS